MGEILGGISSTTPRPERLQYSNSKVIPMAKAPRYEGSKADMDADKKFAKRAGKSVKEYEGSPEDRKRDAAGQKKLSKKK